MDESFEDWSIVEGYYVPKGYPSERFTSLAELKKFVRVATDVKKAKEFRVSSKIIRRKGESNRSLQKRRRERFKCLEEIQ